ncbi:uncharacterized protein BXZ73DRAFT_89999 [Epithele typhae]|uniref:uncharacterized protein n=1 Tax=Epithele typhae TaxID=378194 RepID=UPI00200803D8|nr:uncharacterized protein BXZ73DRAFT_89999 [Epithele typhae]KAH9932056.1 hypothetical protein BXZ73DRAFT_89999 [Epithele typhae]
MIGLTLSSSRPPLRGLRHGLPVRLSRRADPVPAFVLANAPLSHLYSNESWWPSDVSEHVKHVVPEVNFTRVASSVTLETLSTFGSDVFLTSPSWITSQVGIPDSTGHSAAPVTIVLVEKANNTLDAFFFYFYSYDHGGKFGDHVGDWEHTMVRFVNGAPTAFYLSAHSDERRPTNYIGVGTHANYATPGQHCHDLPGDLLCDQTDAGLLWDPALNYRAFWYDPAANAFTAPIDAEGASWLSFTGMWGDEQYRVLEHGQYCIVIGDLVNECRFSSGPTGPIAKNLNRTAVCQKEDGCTVETSL